MKKLFLLLMCVVLAGMSGYAQQVFNLDRAEKVSYTSGRVYAGAKSLEISIYLYTQVNKNITDYCLVEAVCERGYAATVARKSNVRYAVLEVDSVGLNDSNVAEVYCSDRSVYRTDDMEWLAVQPGQHVERWDVKGETKNLFRIRTVDRKVPLTIEVPMSTPTEPTPEVVAFRSDNTGTPTRVTPPVVLPANNTPNRPPLMRK